MKNHSKVEENRSTKPRFSNWDFQILGLKTSFAQLELF